VSPTGRSAASTAMLRIAVRRTASLRSPRACCPPIGPDMRRIVRELRRMNVWTRRFAPLPILRLLF
jgi:hypothetical protein